MKSLLTRLMTLVFAAAVTLSTVAAAQTWINRPPNAPTLLAPANNARIAMRGLQATLQLSWRNNGDPEGERVSFYVETYYFDVYTRAWKPAVRQTVYGTTCPVRFNGSPGSSVRLAWRVYAMDASRRSRPWHSVTGWSVFQVSFPAATTPQQPQQPRQPRPQAQTTTFFGDTWSVWGYHAGTGTWSRYANRPNVFQADWKKGSNTYRTTVTLRRDGNLIIGISRTADGKFHTRFNIYLDENAEVGGRLSAIPRSKKLHASQSRYETTGHNADTAHATLVR